MRRRRRKESSQELMAPAPRGDGLEGIPPTPFSDGVHTAEATRNPFLFCFCFSPCLRASVVQRSCLFFISLSETSLPAIPRTPAAAAPGYSSRSVRTRRRAPPAVSLKREGSGSLLLRPAP